MVEKLINQIYLLKNKINNKIYIGQTWRTLKERQGDKNGIGYYQCCYLYSAIKKYGFENFEYVLLATADTQEEADKLEDFYMEKYNSRNSYIGYNLKSGGVAGRHSDESKAKMSISQTGRITSEETKNKQSISQTGIKKPPCTDKNKEEISKFMKERHAAEGHPMQGKHHTEEAKAKMREALVGKPLLEETIQKRIKTRLSKRDPVVDAKIIADYQAGIEIRVMCLTYGVKAPQIYRIIKRSNIPLRG